MKIKRQNELIQYANEHISPYNPEIMNEKVVYAHLLEGYMDDSEISNEKILLFMELFTEESIEDTIRNLNADVIPEDSYHPAQYTFTVTGDIDSDEASYCNHIKNLCNDNNGWIKGKLCTTAQEGIYGHVSLSFGLVHKEHNNSKLPLELDATFIPIQLSSSDSNTISELRITFSDAIEIINSNSGSLPEVPEESGDDGEDLRIPYKVTVYKVDNANTITIEKDDKCILFDCGKNDYTNPKVINYIIDHVKPTTIIISHWHKDHYNLLTSIDTSRLQHVIYPYYAYSQQHIIDYQNAVCKLACLQKQGVTITDLSKVASYNKDFLKNYGYSNIDCFIGTKQPDPGVGSPLGHINYNRDIDDSGIILSIKSYHNTFRAILPGDCSYYSWPGVNELDLGNTAKLVLPHHGGHIISQSTVNPSSLMYSGYFVSSGFSAFNNLSNSDGTTFHKSFVWNALNRPIENLLYNSQSSGTYFKI